MIGDFILYIDTHTLSPDMAIVTIFYLLANIAYFAVLPPLDMLQSAAVAVTFAEKARLPFGAVLTPLFVAASVFGAMNGQVTVALWFRSAKNQDVSTGPLARPFARSLAPLAHSLAPDCSLRSRPPLRSLIRSLAHFAHSLARGKVNF